MIYVVTNEQRLFESDLYKIITVEESLTLLSSFNVIQFDTETSSLDPHIGQVLCAQFGNKQQDIQIVVDCTTIDLSIYKPVLESKYLIGHNLAFDYKWLFNYGIIPRYTYDTMIVEQLIYLAYPTGMFPKSLQAVAQRYLGIYIDKEVRGQIIWRGLDDSVIKYAAGDVVHLEDIMQEQLKTLKAKDMLKAAKIECDFTICNAYYMWCGVKLDIDKWQTKMKEDSHKRDSALEALNKYIVEWDVSRKYSKIDYQGDLFEGYSLEPKCIINWQSSAQLIPLFKELGFNVTGFDKKKKEEKESIEAKILKGQKGINDVFLKLYLAYSEAAKVCSTYGQQYINAVNPNTGRIHTEFRALGTDTGRLACGSQKINTDLAKLKKLPTIKQKDSSKICAYPQLQNLPNDETTRACFIAEKGNDFISIDYNSEESRLLASLSEDKAMLEVFNLGQDMHSKVAYMIYPTLIPRDTPIQDINKKYHDLRQKAKGPEFCFAFLGNWATLVATYGMSVEEAKSIEENYKKGFYGATRFQEKCKKFIENNGYVVICEETGHKAYWWDWEDWHKRQISKEFWDTYRVLKDSNQPIPEIYSEHFKARNKWDKNGVNSKTQGLGAVIFKVFNAKFFYWLVDKGLFNIVKFCVPVHDEICIECPKEHTKEVVAKLKEIMQTTGELFCHKLPMPAQEEIGEYWKH